MSKEICLLLAVFAFVMVAAVLFGGVAALFLAAYAATVVICALEYVRKGRVRA